MFGKYCPIWRLKKFLNSKLDAKLGYWVHLEVYACTVSSEYTESTGKLQRKQLKPVQIRISCNIFWIPGILLCYCYCYFDTIEYLIRRCTGCDGAKEKEWVTLGTDRGIITYFRTDGVRYEVSYSNALLINNWGGDFFLVSDLWTHSNAENKVKKTWRCQPCCRCDGPAAAWEVS